MPLFSEMIPALYVQLGQDRRDTIWRICFLLVSRFLVHLQYT
jgi:hypothetical protein